MIGRFSRSHKALLQSLACLQTKSRLQPETINTVSNSKEPKTTKALNPESQSLTVLNTGG